MSGLLKDDNLNGVVDKLVDTILEENILSKVKLKDRVRVILSAWVRLGTRAKDYDNIKTDKGVLMRTIEHRGMERDFWYNKYKELVPEDKRRPDYDKLDAMLREQGYKK